MSRAAPGPARPGPFTLVVSTAALLVTLVIAASIWESYYPPLAREALRRRRHYYETVLRDADVSWKDALYYKEVP